MSFKNEESLKWKKGVQKKEKDTVTRDKRQELMHSNIQKKYAVCAKGRSISMRKSL